MRRVQTRRREFLAAIIGAVNASWCAVHAATVSKIPTIGILWHGASAEEEAVYLGAVRQGLLDTGYVEGQNVSLENRFPAEVPERFISLAAELVALKVDVLVAINRIAALAAQRATATIPIVFVAVPDPVGSKLVASLAHPGGNITGLSNFALDLTAKRLEYLKRTVERTSRVALLVNPNDPDMARRYTDECQAAADKLGVFLFPMEIKARGDLSPAFAKMRDERVDGVVVSQDGLFYVSRKDIADLALRYRLPVVVYSRETLQAGALLSYGPSNYAIFRRAGVYVDKILKGAKPADLPVEQPTRFEFIVNLQTAEALGIKVPPTVLAVADEVIE